MSAEHGIEFALMYKTGAGRNGGGGTYWLYSGVERAIQIPVAANLCFIYHAHPGGTPYASRADMNAIALLAQAGSPQVSSQAVLPDGGAVRYGLPDGRADRYGSRWMRDGTYVR